MYKTDKFTWVPQRREGISNKSSPAVSMWPEHSAKETTAFLHSSYIIGPLRFLLKIMVIHDELHRVK